MSFGDLDAFEDELPGFDSWQELAEEDDLAELLDEELEDYEDIVDLEEALRGALLEDYADASPEEMGEALFNVMESMAPAESFNLGKALSQIQKGAGRAMEDPTLRQIAGTALPIAGGAAGTFLGGPAGTAIGTGLGGAAAKAISGSGKATPSATAATIAPSTPAAALTSPTSSIASGSTAAAKGLVLTQQPDVLKSLLALALGDQGRKSVGGVPIGAVMNLLSTTFGQAAADADELLYASDEAPAYLLDGEGQLQTDPAAPADRAQALYAALLGAENQRLAEATGWR